jgi:hypothetical protein
VTSPRSRWLARLIWGAFVAVTLVWILLGGRPGSSAVKTMLFVFVYGSFATMGSLVASRRPENPIGWMMAGAGLGIQTGNLLQTYVERSLRSGGSLPFTEAAAWFGNWLWPASIVSLVFVVLLFPTGAPASRRWGYVVRAAYVGVGCLVVDFMIAPGPLEVTVLEGVGEGIPPIHNPLGFDLGPLRPVLAAVGAVSVPVALILGLISLVVRGTRAAGIERQQVKVFAFTISVLLVVNFLGTPVLAQFLPEDHALRDVTFILGLAMIPLGAGLAVLKYRLYDIDVVVNKTLVYLSLTAILAACYFALIVLLQRVLPVAEDSDLAVAASTLAVAGLFQPLRTRVQAFIDQRFYRNKYDTAETLRDFSSRLRDQLDLDALGRELVAVVGTTMQPAHASLWLRRGHAR